MEVGKEFAVCPGRGKKAVCRAKVISCIAHITWKRRAEEATSDLVYPIHMQYAEHWEAKREGFLNWDGLLTWLELNFTDIDKTYRIEFKVLK